MDVRKTPKSLATEAQAFLGRYPWPGNFREFIHVLKYALLFSQDEEIQLKDFPDYLRKATTDAAPAAAARPALSPPAEVIDFEKLCQLLKQVDSTPLLKNQTTEYPWHIDHAKKTYLRTLIQQCGGNLRKISSLWDCDSEKTVRALIKDLGLWEELERARGKE